ncbi:MAG: fused signal recognition particle receptor, partial [Limisphaerales bacterium]
MGIFDKIFSKKEKKKDLDTGLEKTRSGLFSKLTRAVAGKSKVDDDFLDELEGILISSDVGVDTTIKIIDRLSARVAKDKYFGVAELQQIIRDEIVALLTENNTPDYDDFVLPDAHPYIMLVVGVNGVGKTTTIGKLAWRFQKMGKSVLLGAADTFRAAAVDQLIIWAERTNVPIVNRGMGTDPASVAFDTIKEAKRINADLVLIDTAGRLHNKKALMDELSKIRRVIAKEYPGAPHDVLLVLDGSTGQNAFNQAKAFIEATEVSAIALTKLDGTAKGGVVLGIADQFKIPLKYIGVGE